MFVRTLVSADFQIPTLSTDVYRLEPLTNRWVVQDFAAIIEIFPHLDGLIGPPGSIPKEGSYTIETNVVELGWHEREFRTRSSLAFAAITHDNQREVGCTYLYPSPNPDEDAVGFSWARGILPTRRLMRGSSTSFAPGSSGTGRSPTSPIRGDPSHGRNGCAI